MIRIRRWAQDCTQPCARFHIRGLMATSAVLAGMGRDQGPWRYEPIAPRASQQQQHTPEDESDRRLDNRPPQRPRRADWLAWGDDPAARPVGQRSVFARSAATGRARASPAVAVSQWLAFMLGSAPASPIGPEGAGTIVIAPAAAPFLRRPLVGAVGEPILLQPIRHTQPPANASTSTMWTSMIRSNPYVRGM